MPPQQQQQGGNSDNSLDFLWMIVLIVGILALLWYFFHESVISFVLTLRVYELKFVSYIMEGYGFLAYYLNLPSPNTQKLASLLNTANSKPLNMSIEQLVKLSSSVGRYYMIPIALIIGSLAAYTYFRNISEQFKHIYSMSSLRKSELRIWPQISPVVKVDLVKKSLDEGPWATSLTPMLFAKKNKLLEETKEKGRVTVKLLDGAAYRVLALQVGQFWRGIETLPLHIQALYAIFLARANRDRKVADALLLQISTSALTAKLDFKGVGEIVAKHKDSKIAKFAEKKHAYVLPMMATLLEMARTDGVLATAEFLWLKPIDRPLWYMLNSVGRQTAFPEVAGAFAHWLAEKKVDKPLKVPMVDEAVQALGSAIKEMIYEPEDE